MRVLVTGGAGFIGSHLCSRLLAGQKQVICLDNFMNGELSNIRPLLANRNFKLVKGDVRNIDDINSTVPGVDMIIHLAAQIHVDRSIVEPQMTYKVNVLGTLNVLESARRYDVERIVYASSSEVYGTAEYCPMDEKHPLRASHPYGATKIAADRMCHAYMQTYGLNLAIVRAFNTYGPLQKDTGYGGAIAIFIKRVLNNMPPIIYGDGKQTRDYLYIDDLIDAYMKIIHFDGRLKDVINIGTGREIQILDLAKLIIRICKCDGLIPRHVDPRPGEVQRLCADFSRANSLLGWAPILTLEDGLRRYVQWYQEYSFEKWAKPG